MQLVSLSTRSLLNQVVRSSSCSCLNFYDELSMWYLYCDSHATSFILFYLFFYISCNFDFLGQNTLVNRIFLYVAFMVHKKYLFIYLFIFKERLLTKLILSYCSLRESQTPTKQRKKNLTSVLQSIGALQWALMVASTTNNAKDWHNGSWVHCFISTKSLSALHLWRQLQTICWPGRRGVCLYVLSVGMIVFSWLMVLSLQPESVWHLFFPHVLVTQQNSQLVNQYSGQGLLQQ